MAVHEFQGMDSAFCQDSVVRELPRKPFKECLFTVKGSGVFVHHDTWKKMKSSSGNAAGCNAGTPSSRSKSKTARFGKQEAKRNRRSGWDEDWTDTNSGSTVSAPSSPRSSSSSSCSSTVILRVTPPGSPLAPRLGPFDTNGANSGASSDIHHHLQSMLYLLRPEDMLKMAVKLETAYEGRTRYLAVVFWREECVLLGVDCRLTQSTSIGLCLRLLADTAINLDGDGGFSVSTAGKYHIFKPVSVQAMWSALQTLHRACLVARGRNFFGGSGSHEWAKHYESSESRSGRSCVNEWNAMDDLESRRPPSPGCVLFRCRPDLAEKQSTETMIRAKLKEIMTSVDLDQVTSKSIRIRLEEEMDFDLAEFKSFIDQEMLTILGQMDHATEIFPHLYLGSEWNASNLEELRRNGVTHILNVTREIDNFFPDFFDYYNVRVYDDEATQLLKHWDDTYRYIKKAQENEGKVLVHCKMGISRSASVVVAYTMKRNHWTLTESQEFVKKKRTCVKPNENFLRQLEIYEGILDASRNRHNSIWRSVSESNLRPDVVDAKVSRSVSSSTRKTKTVNDENRSDGRRAAKRGKKFLLPPKIETPEEDHEVRPKSWSPSSDELRERKRTLRQTSESSDDPKPRPRSYTDSNKSPTPPRPQRPLRNICWRQMKSGETYSVSPNKVIHLDNPPEPPKKPDGIVRSSSIKDRISELENSQQTLPPTAKCYEDLPDRTGWVQSLANQFEAKSKPDEPSSQTYCAIVVVKQSKAKDPFSSQVDKVFDREERKKTRDEIVLPQISVVQSESPSRQSSFGSVDSAIVVGSENPSRQSSWGSCDTGVVVSSGQPPLVRFQEIRRRRWPPEAPADQGESEAGVVQAIRREMEASSRRRSASVPKFGGARLSAKPPVPERKSSLECLSKFDTNVKLLPDGVKLHRTSSRCSPLYGTL